MAISEKRKEILRKRFEENENSNHHLENNLMLAREFGTSGEVDKVLKIKVNQAKNQGISYRESQWLYKNIHKKYIGRLY